LQQITLFYFYEARHKTFDKQEVLNIAQWLSKTCPVFLAKGVDYPTRVRTRIVLLPILATNSRLPMAATGVLLPILATNSRLPIGVLGVALLCRFALNGELDWTFSRLVFSLVLSNILW